ncbi:angiopoietin-related protein 6 isoform X1 [Scomber scombrus]
MTPAEIVVRSGDPASIKCNTLTNDFDTLRWEAKIGGKTSDQSSLTWEVNALEDWDIEPKCFVTIRLSQCFVTPVITVYKTPDNVSISEHGPMIEGKVHQLTCEIINVAPVRNLTVKWYRDNDTVHTQMFNDSSVTPVNVSSTLSITPQRNYIGAHFRCETELHLGPNGPETIPTTSSASYIIAEVQYAPTFNEGNYSKELTLGENVTFACSAEGNPTPKVVWEYKSATNVRETTWACQKTVSITRATYDNAVEYKCVATNKVGKLTRSVKLRIKDIERYDLSQFTVWSQLRIIIIIIITILFLCITVIASYKHEKILNPNPNPNPDEANDGSNIPMNTMSTEQA